ncbi:MAG: sulfatase-like hydrolase/transferase [Planctomycetota bacterium]
MTRFVAFLFLLSAVAPLREARAADPARPNIIVIMADDLGAEGLACYGSTIYTTPNLDRMASEGLRFNNAYTSPLCTPTRVMLMSGLYPNRTGFQGLISKDEDVRLPPAIKTFGHYFREAGYRTAIAGKWQLGQFDHFPDQPVEHGFDRYCMWTWQYNGKKTSRYYAPQIYRDGKIFDGSARDFGPDYYSQFLLDFIDENRSQPFFIYYPMALVHSPFINPPSLDQLARTKFTGDLDKKTVEFGHMITYMDDIVGKFMAKLKERGLDRNTLVVFTGDNGTGREITSKLAGMNVKGGKGTMTEAGSRVPLLAWWPETIKPGVREQLFSFADVLPTITSVAGIPLSRNLDGMDLSHVLFGKEGKDREQVFINHGRGYFVRESRFRLNQDGKLYDIPVTSDKERYSEKVTIDPAHEADRRRLQAALDQFLAIECEIPTKLKSGKKTTPSKKKQK